MSLIKVLLADDHTVLRKGLRALLEAEANIEVVGEANDGREAISQTENLRPDIVVMDISMPGLNGLEATRQIKKQFPNIKVIILTMHATEEYVLQILRAGASGYLVKQAAPEELVLAINSVYGGASFLSPTVSHTLIDAFLQQSQATTPEDSYEQLTNREREVLQLIAEGNSSRQVAELLHISEKTVRTHRANIMEKINLHSTAELTQYAIRRGIINPK